MMMKEFSLVFTDKAKDQFARLRKDKSKQNQYKAVGKALAYMKIDLRHPGLHTHEYSRLSKTFGSKIFESYAQNSTPGAYRIFWCYGPKQEEITILSITSHP